jgi:hypothetical protein
MVTFKYTSRKAISRLKSTGRLTDTKMHMSHDLVSQLEAYKKGGIYGTVDFIGQVANQNDEIVPEKY